MTSLDDLARHYDAFERVDKSTFQRQARVLQSIWREEQGFPIGVQRSRANVRPLGSRLKMPWAENTLANYLTDTIKDVVRLEVLDPAKSAGKLYGRPRIFEDLLSSQPMAFNLFGELQNDLGLASVVFRSLTNGRVQTVSSIDFEYSPGRGDPRYTGDRSAFDVFATYTTSNGMSGFAGIEVKYHENLIGEPATHRNRYDELARLMGCFREDHLDHLKHQPLQQIWRDHLLAGSILAANDYSDGFFVFLYPGQNGHCSEAVRQYSECLSDFKSFAPWTLEMVCDAIKETAQVSWVETFIARYLRFEKLDR